MPPTQSRRRNLSLALATLLALGAGVSGQQQRPVEGAAPSGVQLVSMDFLALTSDGRPVLNLKPEDVTVRVNGKVRPIKSLRLVQFAGAPPADPAVPRLEPPPPAFGSNLAVGAPRAIVLVVDDESIPIGQERKLREALKRFVDELPPQDRVAVVTVPHGGIKVDLTTSRDRLHRGIDTISPIDSIEGAGCRTRDALRALMNTMDTLSGGEQPVTMAFLSASLVGTSQLEQAQRVDAQTGRGGLSAQAGSCLLQNEDFARVGESAAGSRVQLYVIHPDFSQAPARAGVENLRGVTGAPLFHLTSGQEPGLTRMIRETSAYYLATFETLSNERNGAAHQVAVRVAQNDVVVRSRPNIVLGKPQPAAGPAVAMMPRDIVRSSGVFQDLPMRVAGFASRGAGNALKVIALFEAVEPNTSITGAAAGLFDATGRFSGQWTAGEGDLSGRSVTLAMSAPAGTYRLRVAAVDTIGRTGAADYEVVAELTPAGKMTLSSLVLGLSRDGGFVPRLQFTGEASAIAYLEIYGGVAGAPVGVMFEVAQTTNGAPFLQVPGAAAPTSEEGRVIVMGTIPVGALPAGDYVVRAVVAVEGQPAGRVVRTLHKAGS